MLDDVYVKQYESFFHHLQRVLIQTYAHTFEYYLDRVLFRGLYPTLPQVILGDMRIYEEHGVPLE